MSVRTQINDVADSVPFDNDTNGFSAEDVQTAIEEVDSKITGKPRAFLIAGYNGNASTNRWLEYFHSVSSQTSPWVSAEDGTVEGVSLSAKTNATCTVSLFINGSSVASISLSASQTNFDNSLAVNFNAGDTFSCQVTSGSISDPIFSTKVQTDL